ncbi:MAG: hypothetical protein HWD85_09315 [Flavobacteriaceae bacterium]|nr:hypothetical protein [Flavobacteriaceae bacterium]
MNSFSFVFTSFSFNDFPIIIKIIWILAAIFFLILLFFIVYLKVLRHRLRVKEATNLELEKKYEELIITYVFADSGEGRINEAQSVIIEKIKPSLQNTNNRKIFIKSLMKLMGEVSGGTVNSVDKLFIALGLLKQARAKLQHKKWHIIAIGIRDLRVFKIKEVREEVKVHINHPRTEVRTQAYLYFIEVFGFEGLDFLDDLTAFISKWDQIGILGALENIKQQNMPDVKRWLCSENDSVVLLTLELVKIYNIFNTTKELLDLIHHNNADVRLKSIQVLSYFFCLEAVVPLKEIMNSLTEKEQIAVLKMLENMATEQDEAFILSHINSPVFDIKVMALKILKRINHGKFLAQKEDNKDSTHLKIIEFLEKN